MDFIEALEHASLERRDLVPSEAERRNGYTAEASERSGLDRGYTQKIHAHAIRLQKLRRGGLSSGCPCGQLLTSQKKLEVSFFGSLA